MKHLNQINGVLVVLSLAVVFYSLGQTFFDQQTNPIQVLSTSREASPTGVSPDLESEPLEVRTPRNRMVPTARPGIRDRETNPAAGRRAPMGGSPQVEPSSNPGATLTAPPRSRTRVLTTPPARSDGRDVRSSEPGAITATPGNDEEFLKAVDRMRQEQGAGLPPSKSTRPGVTPGSTKPEDRRRQTTPPPARSSMADRRPPL